jgi:preprotein translocase subunit SecF
MNIPNIYNSKNYKYYAAVPIILLIASLFFIGSIHLDSSLKGGVSIQLQTNSSTANIRALSAAIDSRIPGAEASVSRSPGGISVLIAENTSVAAAFSYLLNIYGFYSNYTNEAVLLASYQNELSSQPNNATLRSLITSAENNETRYTQLMAAAFSSELSSLGGLYNSSDAAYNSSSAISIVNAAKNAYTDASSNYESRVLSTLHQLIPFSSYSYQDVTPTLGSFFLRQMKDILIVSFILIGIAVFFIFRSIIPPLAAIFGAANDIIIALGGMGLFGIPLGIASIGGLLMLIGYSIDTELLSSIRILKRGEETPQERAFGAMKTGTTMTFAAIITFTILLVMSYETFIPTYFEISGVVLIGLIADLATTWLGNVPLILWYKLKRVDKVG